MPGLVADVSSQLYLDLLKRILTRYGFDPPLRRVRPRGRVKQLAVRGVEIALSPTGLELARRNDFDPDARTHGLDWPATAETMIGLERLDNLHGCMEEIVRTGVPGDFVEAGVWRGGTAIFMRAFLKARGIDNRVVWAADSFEGLPKPDPRYALDAGNKLWAESQLSVSLEEVKANFERYGLLDERVRFIVGLFEETLADAPIGPISLMRLDGDLYSSTISALTALHPRLQPGGFVIIDDWTLPGANSAVRAFRAEHGITEPLVDVDGQAVYWRRER
jgi:O-methyltransferase